MLVVRDDNLVVDHDGGLTDADRDAIRTLKPELLALLAGPSPAVPSPAVAGPPVPPEWRGARLDLHWRAAIAWWPVEWRRRWGVRANELEAAGCAWNVAEYWAWREMLQALGQAEARGERVKYQEPLPPSDSDVISALDRATDPEWWSRPAARGPSHPNAHAERRSWRSRRQPGVMRGEVNPEDLDENGNWSADRFFARLRREIGVDVHWKPLADGGREWRQTEYKGG
jgi:hypothetical protein